MCFCAVVFDACSYLEFPRRARLIALLFHGDFKARLVNVHAALAGNVRRQIQRKSISVIKHEGRFTVEHFFTVGKFAFEYLHTVFEGLGEAFFFRFDDLLDARLITTQLGIGIAHRLGQGADQFEKE